MTDARTYATCLRDVERETLANPMASVVEIAPTLVRYWQEPSFAAALDAETEHHRAEAHAARQIVVKAQWEAVWAREEEDRK